jgi:hypothetical protein
LEFSPIRSCNSNQWGSIGNGWYPYLTWISFGLIFGFLFICHIFFNKRKSWHLQKNWLVLDVSLSQMVKVLELNSLRKGCFILRVEAIKTWNHFGANITLRPKRKEDLTYFYMKIGFSFLVNLFFSLKRFPICFSCKKVKKWESENKKLWVRMRVRECGWKWE